MSYFVLFILNLIELQFNCIVDFSLYICEMDRYSAIGFDDLFNDKPFLSIYLQVHRLNGRHHR